MATCWEEGPKAYHNANNSWYTLNDGGPWSPWIPSRLQHPLPRLRARKMTSASSPSRTFPATFLPSSTDPGSFYGTHPQNVLRGMVYKDGEYPYLFNLIDQYRSLDKYNNGFTYNMVFVGPGWMSKQGRWEAPYALLEKSYQDCMAYYGELKREEQGRGHDDVRVCRLVPRPQDLHRAGLRAVEGHPLRIPASRSSGISIPT